MAFGQDLSAACLSPKRCRPKLEGVYEVKRRRIWIVPVFSRLSVAQCDARDFFIQRRQGFAAPTLNFPAVRSFRVAENERKHQKKYI